MPISKNVDRVSSSGAGSLTPLIRNGYRLALVFPPPAVWSPNEPILDATGGIFNSYFDMMAGGDPLLAASLSNTASRLRNPNNSYPFEVEFSPPNVSTETRKVRRGNVSINYPGFVDVGECFMTFNNFVESELALFMLCWHQMSAGITRNSPNPVELLPGNATFISRVAPRLFKVNGFLYQYGHQQDASNNDEEMQVRRVYEMYGVYISTLTTGALDNSNSGDMQELKAQFAVDYFQPESAGSTYETESVQFVEQLSSTNNANALDRIPVIGP